MAVVTWYLTSASASIGSDLSLSDPGAEGYRSPTTGWIVSTGTTNRSEYRNDVEQAASTFADTNPPDGSLDTTNGDFWVSPSAITGTFASGNWTISVAVRAQTNGGAHDGLAYARIFRGPNQDGSSATEVTSAATAGTGVTNLATSATQVSTVTVNPGAFAVSDEYIFIQIAWGRTGAGGMTNSDVNLRVGNGSGTGSRVVTSDFAQVHAFTATGVTTGAPSVGSPAISQTHALTATGVATGAPTVGSPALAEVTALVAVGVATGAPTVGTPTLGQTHALEAAELATGAPTVGSPTLGQVHGLDAVGIVTGTPTVGAPDLGQTHALVPVGVATGSPTVGAPTLSEIVGAHNLTAIGVTMGAPTVGAPLLTIVAAAQPQRRGGGIAVESRAQERARHRREEEARRLEEELDRALRQVWQASHGLDAPAPAAMAQIERDSGRIRAALVDATAAADGRALQAIAQRIEDIEARIAALSAEIDDEDDAVQLLAMVA